MELTVLGSAGGWPTPGRACAGYLVSHGGFNLWLDAGPGSLANLQKRVALADIGSIAISHAHPDHFTDLYQLLIARHYGKQGAGALPVFVPIGFESRFAGLLSEDTADAARAAFEVREVTAGGTFEAGPFWAEAFGMRHIEGSLGFRLAAGGASLAYTGDTGPTEQVEGLARDADMFLSEATWPEDAVVPPIHLRAGEAGAFARRAGAHMLILTHIWPTLDPEVSRAAAAGSFPGDILLAYDGMRVEVGE